MRKLVVLGLLILCLTTLCRADPSDAVQAKLTKILHRHFGKHIDTVIVTSGSAGFRKIAGYVAIVEVIAPHNIGSAHLYAAGVTEAAFDSGLHINRVQADIDDPDGNGFYSTETDRGHKPTVLQDYEPPGTNN